MFTRRSWGKNTSCRSFRTATARGALPEELRCVVTALAGLEAIELGLCTEADFKDLNRNQTYTMSSELIQRYNADMGRDSKPRRRRTEAERERKAMRRYLKREANPAKRNVSAEESRREMLDATAARIARSLNLVLNDQKASYGAILVHEFQSTSRRGQIQCCRCV